MAVRVAIASQKGGVGKTATAISLGSALARSGRRVLLVDVDPQANATSGLGLSKQLAPSVYELLLRDASLEAASVPTAIPGLDMVPSSSDMASAEVELVPMLGREFRLRVSLSRDADHDLVLIDCPPSLGLLTINALVAADLVIVPV